MSFPLKYVGEVVLNKPEGFIFEAYQRGVQSNLNQEKEAFGNKYHHTYSIPFVGLSIRYKLHLKEEHSTIHVRYLISLFELNILFLIFGGLALFFAFTNQHALMFLATIVAIGMYWFGINTVSNGLKRIVKHKMTDAHVMEELGLWEKQQLWIKQNERCSACGEKINPYTAYCINCGLKHQEKVIPKEDISPSNTTSSINYDYKNLE